ncbi:MAG: hydantoinase/oxoprolinase family protein [Rhizobiaceae bacterium]
MTASKGNGVGYRVGIDIGGTFTDVVLVNEQTGSVGVVKVPTVPSDPSEGFLHGLNDALRKFGIDPKHITFLVHGTTIATNTIIQGQGAKAGLITSEGFSDVLEIAYQTRPVLYDIFYDKPKPLVPRHMCVGVPERMSPTGEMIVPLDPAAVESAARRLIANGATAIVVAFLHSYRNPAHERAAAEVISHIAPDLPVVTSAEVCPEYREYPRTSTAAVNAVLLPKVAPYISRLENRLSERGVSTPLHLMTSSGGIATSQTAKRFPVHLVESGPAAGVIGASFVAEDLRDDRLSRRVLALDIGGTTAKASLIDDGMPALADEFEVGAAAVATSTAGRGQGYPIKMPVINLVEIGAGGGSIAYIDPGGALAVGPESAGADPGPACYGKGGKHPTITDANLILGLLNPDYFLGGAFKLDVEIARDAIGREVAKPLRISVEEAAQMIIDIANAKMVAALQLVSVRKGIDPREYALVPSGGAGPLHVMAIARQLGVSTVVIPPTPGLNSALGLLATDVKHEIVHPLFRATLDMNREAFVDLLNEMERKGRQLLGTENVESTRIAFLHEAEVCYAGQNYPLRVAVDPAGDASLETLSSRFRELHRSRYGFASDTEPTMLFNLRTTAIGRVERPRLNRLNTGSTDPVNARKQTRRVFFGGPLECPAYDRERLQAGNEIVGPAIIEQMDTTTVLPPGTFARVHESGSLVITLQAVQ